MARFQFSLRSLIAGSSVHPVVSQRSLRALNLQDAADAPKGPGWFDSSWELEHGLRVSEGLPGDAGLYEWLDVALRS